MSSSVLLRAACADDLPGVLALERATADAPRWSEAAYREYVTTAALLLQRRALFVAIGEGGLRGFAAAAAVAEQAELESIAVAAGAQRCGLGSRLLTAVHAWARAQGARALLLEVRAGNARALAFYAARGFVRDGLRRRYYKEPIDDAVLMRLNLLPREAGDEPRIAGEL